MNKVYLLWEHWTVPYEESDSLIDVYSTWEDANAELIKLTAQNDFSYAQYSVSTEAVK